MTTISNILYLHETALISGAERSLLALIAELDKGRFRVSVACPAGGPLPDKLMELGARVHPVDYPKIRMIAGVHATVDQLRRIVKEDDIALIHSNSIRTHIYAWLAGHPDRTPVIWHERNMTDTEIVDPDRCLSFLPDAIICNSEAIARRFMKHGRMPDKVCVIHNGVDLDRFNPSVSGDGLRRRFGIDADETVIGIASRFNKSKGHEIFLEAAVKLMRAVPGADNRLRFLISGGAVFGADMEREAALKRAALREGLSGRVIFTGFSDNMPEVYSASDIIVLASTAEACGRVVSEAMACGKPVVGTDSGGTPEMIADGVTGILVKAGDAAGLAAALKTLIGDRDKRLAMGRESRKRAEKEFDIKIHAKETEDLYLRVINRVKA